MALISASRRRFGQPFSLRSPLQTGELNAMHRITNRPCLLLITIFALTASIHADKVVSKPDVKKIKDIIIYKDDTFYSAFPSIVRRSSGELLCAFRRAPNRRLMGVSGYSHTDP